MKNFVILMIGVVGIVFVSGTAKADDPQRDKVIFESDRFFVLTEFNDESAWDREIGLRWQRTLNTTSNTWKAARNECVFPKLIGGPKGWRLTSFHELSSLVDTPVSSNSVLPQGHLML